MISPGSSVSRPRDGSYRKDGEYQATGEVAQDHRATRAQFNPRNQRSATVTRNRPAARVLRVRARPLHGRFASLDSSDPAKTGAATRRTGRCRSPPATGGPADRASRAATQAVRFDLLSIQNSPLPPSRTAATSCQEPPLIILGVILLIIGFIAKIAIIWTIGIVVLVIGVILALLGVAGHAVGGRKHYF